MLVWHIRTTPPLAHFMNILAAVTEQNAHELEKCLKAGWQPPRLNHVSSGLVTDYGVWTEVVLRDWKEGLEILHRFFPQLSTAKEVFDVALKNASGGCVEFLWEQNEFRAEDIPLETQKQWILAMMVGMGEPWSLPHEIKDVLPVYHFLTHQGLDLSSALPGDFEPNDLRMAGHSLWTRAVFLKNWELVDAFWPHHPAQWSGWPRLNEVLFHMVAVLVGDYRSLIAEHKQGEFPEEDVLFRWLNDFEQEWLEASHVPSSMSSSIVVDPSREPLVLDALPPSVNTPSSISSGSEEDIVSDGVLDVDTSWDPSLDIQDPDSDEAEPNIQNTELTHHIPLYRFMARPSQEKIAPFLRLPMTLQNSRREQMWAVWERVLSHDPELSWLHEIAMYPDDSDVQKLILLARHDHAIAFHKFWARPSASGFSPHERWVNMGGDPALVQLWVPLT